MFKALLKQIKNLFDGEFPDLDEAEKKCMSAKNSPFLREKITFLPGGRFGKGQIVMTKTIDPDFQNFFSDFFYGLRIPGIFSIDAHGFVQNSDGEPVFIFGSKNSSIELWDGSQAIYLDR